MENCTWPARGWSFGSDAFTKVGDLLQALLLVWSVSEKDVAEKVCWKSSPAGSGFWRRSNWPESIGRWGRWPEWNTVTGRFPGVDDTGNWKELGFLLWLWYHVERERKKKDLNSHSCNIYLQLRNIYIYTRLGVLTTIHVTYINKEILYTINTLYSTVITKSLVHSLIYLCKRINYLLKH